MKVGYGLIGWSRATWCLFILDNTRGCYWILDWILIVFLTISTAVSNFIYGAFCYNRIVQFFRRLFRLFLRPWRIVISKALRQRLLSSICFSFWFRFTFYRIIKCTKWNNEHRPWLVRIVLSWTSILGFSISVFPVRVPKNRKLYKWVCVGSDRSWTSVVTETES